MGNQPTTQSRDTYNIYNEAIEHYVRRGHYYRRAASDDCADGSLPIGHQKVIFAAGCFWGTEKAFWRLPGVYATAVGYIGGDDSEKPTYRKVCSGKTGHAEATLVIYDSSLVTLVDLLRLFFACHDPTQGDGQGNDRGTQYRSGIYVSNEEDATIARAAITAMDNVLSADGYPSVTTELEVGRQFWYAEPKHQCYLAKPGSRQYCSAEPTGRKLPYLTDFPSHLPSVFWEVFDFSIRATNKPMTWEGGEEAIVRAQGEAKQQKEIWQESKLKAERESGVIIRFCGGCGFAHRAKELQEYLDAAIGLRPSLLRE
jgi:peptide-methionine (S)-S-oxide reductase